MSILSRFIHQRILLFNFFVFLFSFYYHVPFYSLFASRLCCVQVRAVGKSGNRKKKKMSANISERSASLPLKYADTQPKEEEVNKKNRETVREHFKT